ncbi:hypothetical protein [Nonomuraea dietziae]|uniref:hypothetical protein n=1 Tax=Nonomuraea dietziae TaxID=65515 RepID=UPI0031DF8B6E
MDELVGPGEQIARAVFCAVGVDRGDPLGIGLRQPPETERAHGDSSQQANENLFSFVAAD